MEPHDCVQTLVKSMNHNLKRKEREALRKER